MLSDCNVSRTNNHSVRKQTLNHLAKLGVFIECVITLFTDQDTNNILA